MKKLISAGLIIYFFLNCLIAFSQTSGSRKEDNYLQQLARHPEKDEKHLGILLELATVQEFAKAKDGLLTIDKAISLAEHLKAIKVLAAALNMKARLLIYEASFDSAENYVNRSIFINTKLNDFNGIADNYLTMAIIKLNAARYNENLEWLEKAQLTASPTADPLFSGRLNFNLGLHYGFTREDIKKSIDYLHKALGFFEPLADTAWLGNTFMQLSISHLNDTPPDSIRALSTWEQAYILMKTGGYLDLLAMQLIFKGQACLSHSEYKSGIAFLNEAMDISIRTKNNSNISYSRYNLGYIYLNMADYPKALDNFTKCERESRQMQNDFMDLSVTSMIGVIYSKLNDFESALKYQRASMLIAAHAGSKDGMLSGHQEVGHIFIKQNKFRDALDEYKKAMDLSVENKDQVRIAECHGFLGDAYEKLQQYDLAFEHYGKAATLNKKLDIKYFYALNLIAIGRTLNNSDPVKLKDKIGGVFNSHEKNKLAIGYVDQAIEIIKKTGELDLQRDAYFELSSLYEKEKNLPESMKYYRQYVLFKDSMMNSSNASTLANIQTAFETEKKEQEILLLNKNSSLQQTEIGKQKTQRNAFIGGILLVLLLAGVIVNRYQLKQKANRDIENTLDNLKTKQEQLIQQGKLASLGKMTAQVAMEIQNPIIEVKNFSTDCESLVGEYEMAIAEDQRTAILEKLKINLSRISLNGRQADNIVKDVLLKSRK